MTRAREVQKRADAVRPGDGMLDFGRMPYLYAPVVEVVTEADGVLRFTLANGRVDRELPGNVCDVLEVTGGPYRAPARWLCSFEDAVGFCTLLDGHTVPHVTRPMGGAR